MFKRMIFPATLLLMITSTVDAAEKQKAPSIAKVLVFNDRAQVTRVIKVNCTSANEKHEALFPSLPSVLDPRTLRAEASGSAEALGVMHKRVSSPENIDSGVASMQKKLKLLQEKVKEKNEHLQTMNERIARLRAYEQYYLALFREQARTSNVEPKKWAEYLESSTTERMDTWRKKVAIQAEVRKLSRSIDVLNRKLGRLASKNTKEAIDASVALICRKPGESRVQLSYVIGGATWHPQYDIRYIPGGWSKTGKGHVELTIAAIVQQSTGEDWDDTKLALSTSKPRLGVEAPYPAPLIINGNPAGKKKVLVEAVESRDELQGPAGLMDFGPTGAGLEDKGQSFTLSMKRRVTVKSDARPYWMPIDVLTVKASAKLVTIPKLKPYIYQLVSMHNPAPYPLLQGRAHVFRKDSYIGDIHLDYVAPGEPMEVSLGTDEEFEVKRTSLLHERRRPGIFSSMKHLERGYKISLVNHSKNTRQIEVRENIPVSKIEDVEVDLSRDKSTRGFKFDKYKGFISWNVKLKSGDKKDINLYYTINLPKDWQVKIR